MGEDNNDRIEELKKKLSPEGLMIFEVLFQHFHYEIGLARMYMYRDLLSALKEFDEGDSSKAIHDIQAICDRYEQQFKGNRHLENLLDKHLKD